MYNETIFVMDKRGVTMSLWNDIKDFFSNDKEKVRKISVNSFESWKGVETTTIYGNDEGYTCQVKRGYNDDIESIRIYPPEGKGEPLGLPNKKSVERKIKKGKPMSKLYAEYKQKESKQWLRETRKNKEKIIDAQNKIRESIEKMEQATPAEKEEINGLISKLKNVIRTTEYTIKSDYNTVSPQLASLRRKEKMEIAQGVDPKVAKQERRQAVSAYYKKKESQNE